MKSVAIPQRINDAYCVTVITVFIASFQHQLEDFNHSLGLLIEVVFLEIVNDADVVDVLATGWVDAPFTCRLRCVKVRWLNIEVRNTTHQWSVASIIICVEDRSTPHFTQYLTSIRYWHKTFDVKWIHVWNTRVHSLNHLLNKIFHLGLSCYSSSKTIRKVVVLFFFNGYKKWVVHDWVWT